MLDINVKRVARLRLGLVGVLICVVMEFVLVDLLEGLL